MASSHLYILVTGANIGLGLGICHRLIDDFQTNHPPSSELTLIFTTRSPQKGKTTQQDLSAHIAKSPNSTTSSISNSSRIHLRPENIELTDLRSVLALANKLLHDPTIPKLDALILNAGIAGTTGIDFPLAIWQILTENAAATTWPRFKRSAVGSVTGRQLLLNESSSSSGDDGKASRPEPEPPLGQVFCANVFGHYLFSHGVMGLLRKCAREKPGRVIWISSIEAGAEHFDEDDLMGLRSGTAYECSKRVTDLLALTADGVDAARGSVGDFMAMDSDGDEEESQGTTPEIHVAHPGIVTTSIVPLPPVLMNLWMATAYVMRWVGSPWHTNTAYNGAVSAVWLALASSEEIREKQGSTTAASGKKVKWGSAVDRRGNARVEMTDVQGWGLDGSGRPVRETWWGGGWGRRTGATDATGEEVEEFVRQGARVWRAMEELRVDWERRIRENEERGSSRS